MEIDDDGIGGGGIQTLVYVRSYILGLGMLSATFGCLWWRRLSGEV